MTRNKKQSNGQFTYKSLFTGEYVMAQQWIAEVLVQRKATRENISLPYKYWLKDSTWKIEFQKQVQQAARLIKKYSEEAVLTFLKNNQYKFSLLPKSNIEEIEKTQYIINSRVKTKEIETQCAFEFIQPKNGQKSLLGKLNENKRS